MRHLKKCCKVGVSILLSIICIFGSSLTVFADPTTTTAVSGGYNGRAGQFIQFSKDSGMSDIDLDKITPNELRAFGVFFSNFLTPDQTKIDNGSFNIDIEWEKMLQVFGKGSSDSVMQTIKDKYMANVKNLKPLYVAGQGDNGNLYAQVAFMCNYHMLSGDMGETPKVNGVDFKKVSRRNNFFWIDSGVEHTVFTTRTTVGRASILALESVIGDANTGSTNISQSDYLYVSPFGDIYACSSTVVAEGDKTYYLLLPACMNPYAFDERGSQFRMNNAFMLGSMLYQEEMDNVGYIAKVDDTAKYTYSTDITKASDLFAHGLVHVPGRYTKKDTFINYAFLDDEEREVSYKKGSNGGAVAPGVVSQFMHSSPKYSTYPMIGMTGDMKEYNFGSSKDFEILLNLGSTSFKTSNSSYSKGSFVYLSNWADDVFLQYSLNSYNGIDTGSARTRVAVMGINKGLYDYCNDVSNWTAVRNYGSGGQTWYNSETAENDFSSTSGQTKGFKYIRTALNDEGNTLLGQWGSNLGVSISAGSSGVQWTDLHICLGTTLKKGEGGLQSEPPSFVDISKVVNDEEQKIVSMFFGGFRNGSDAYSNIWWHTAWGVDSLSYFQIPMEEVDSTIGVFNSGTVTSASDGLQSVKAVDLLETSDKGGGFVEDAYSVKVNEADWLKKPTESVVYGTSDYGVSVLGEKFYYLDDSLSTIVKDATPQVDGGSRVASNTNLWAGIYFGYLTKIASLKISDTGEIENDVGNEVNFDWLPPMDSNGTAKGLAGQLSGTSSSSDAEAIAQKKQADIIDWVYKILVGGAKGAGEVMGEVGDYVVNWLKSLVDSLFIGMHNKLVGIDMTSALTGTVQNVGNAGKSGVYSTAMGYVTTPSFESLPVTSWVVGNYTVIYIGLMLLVSVILVFMVVSRARRLPQAVMIFIVMAFVLVLPAQLLDGGILVSNYVAEKIYSEKFMYWAVVQHAETLSQITSANSSSAAILSENLSRQSEYAQRGGVTVKWLSPKKWGITEKLKASSKNANGMSLFMYLAGDMLDGEVYTGNSDSTFMYRTYEAIWLEANAMYSANTSGSGSVKFSSSENKGSVNLITSKIANQWFNSSGAPSDYGMANKMKESGTDLTYDLSKGTAPTTAFFRYTTNEGDSLLRAAFGKVGKSVTGSKLTYPVGYYDSYYAGTGIMDVRHNSFTNNERIYALYMDKSLISSMANFNASKVLWNSASNEACGLWLDIITDDDTSSSGTNTTAMTNGIRTFVDYSESPYYYFYSVFSDTKVKTVSGEEVTGANDMVGLLLSKDFFEVTDSKSAAYGTTKDYLDMEGLFTYIVPLLRYSNQDVFTYENAYGLEVKQSDYATEAEYQKHKDQLQAVWNLYSPWVDALYEANGTAQTAKSGYGSVTVSDALNPASYRYQGRPMSFSPAESVLRGYQDMDLTEVEQKIQNVLNDTRQDLIELLNYKDFVMIDNGTGVTTLKGNDILVSAAAMLATFHFNQEFSDTGLFSTNIQLYPLSFELTNMNYDSYLRLILGNSMGTTVSLNENLTVYDNLIHNTSFVTALILILVDVMGIFIIPVMKICLIVVLFALALALCVSCIINAPDKIFKTILNTFVLPLFGMLAIFTGHAVVVSWFIGNGVVGVIDYQSIAVSTGDPTITLLLLLIVDVVTAILMWLLLKWSALSTAKYIKSTVVGVTAMGKGLFSGTVGALAGAGVVAAGTAKVVGKGVNSVRKTVMGGTRSERKTSRSVKKLVKQQNQASTESTYSSTSSSPGAGGTTGSRSASRANNGANTTTPGNNGNASTAGHSHSRLSSESPELAKTNTVLKEISGKLDKMTVARGGMSRAEGSPSWVNAAKGSYTQTKGGVYVPKESAPVKSTAKSSGYSTYQRTTRQTPVQSKPTQHTRAGQSGTKPAEGTAVHTSPLILNGNWEDRNKH